MKRIYIVDDLDTDQRTAWSAREDTGFERGQAVARVQACTPLKEAVFAEDTLDVNMPRISGIEMLRRVRERGLMRPTLVFSHDSEPQLAAPEKCTGAQAWPVKPGRSSPLIEAISKLVDQ